MGVGARRAVPLRCQELRADVDAVVRADGCPAEPPPGLYVDAAGVLHPQERRRGLEHAPAQRQPQAIQRLRSPLAEAVLEQDSHHALATAETSCTATGGGSGAAGHECVCSARECPRSVPIRFNGRSATQDRRAHVRHPGPSRDHSARQPERLQTCHHCITDTLHTLAKILVRPLPSAHNGLAHLPAHLRLAPHPQRIAAARGVRYHVRFNGSAAGVSRRRAWSRAGEAEIACHAAPYSLPGSFRRFWPTG